MEHTDPKDLRAMLESDAGRQIAAMLQKLDADTRRRAVAAASAGDHQQVKALLTPFLNGERHG